MQKVGVHPLSKDPTEAWKLLVREQKASKIKLKPPETPVTDRNVRFVCMSDTHSLLHQVAFSIPDGDVFIHAGDFSTRGNAEEVKDFNEWLGTLPHKYKIVICGNHDLGFDPKFQQYLRQRHQERLNRRKDDGLSSNCGNDTKELDMFNVRQHLTNCIFLEDSSTEVYGIKIYGSPWQPEFATMGFNLERGAQLLEKWNLIPDDTDILVTHGPPVGHGDFACAGVRVGCVDLLMTIQKRVKPKYHIFGHIHEGYGVSTDGETIYINASTCDVNYSPDNLPIVFDYPVPNGYSK